MGGDRCDGARGNGDFTVGCRFARHRSAFLNTSIDGLQEMW
jgi:hypothetical protein